MNDKITTRSGRIVRPMDLYAEDVDGCDIAHALSHQCRFSGHTSEHYSVGQHCLYAMFLAPPEHRLWALLHDASEAYLVDLPSPLKQLDCMQPYREAERLAMLAVCKRFGLAPEVPACIGVIDRRLLQTEQKHLMPVQLPPEAIPYDFEIGVMQPKVVRDLFTTSLAVLAGDNRRCLLPPFSSLCGIMVEASRYPDPSARSSSQRVADLLGHLFAVEP